MMGTMKTRFALPFKPSYAACKNLDFCKSPVFNLMPMILKIINPPIRLKLLSIPSTIPGALVIP